VPEVAILDIPFLFAITRRRGRARRPDRPGAAAEISPKGIVALAWAENGFRHMTNSKRAVNAPDDLKGLKMRTMENPIHIQAYKQFGILPHRWHSPRSTPRCSRAPSTARRIRFR
jgi:TRAP-type C4-dicarboxylate transport system substrate-binding protein